MPLPHQGRNHKPLAVDIYVKLDGELDIVCKGEGQRASIFLGTVSQPGLWCCPFAVLLICVSCVGKGKVRERRRLWGKEGKEKGGESIEGERARKKTDRGLFVDLYNEESKRYIFTVFDFTVESRDHKSAKKIVCWFIHYFPPKIKRQINTSISIPTFL